MAYIFEDADNCESIHTTLVQLVYGLCAGYTIGVFMCVAAAILSGLALRMERTQEKVQKVRAPTPAEMFLPVDF